MSINFANQNQSFIQVCFFDFSLELPSLSKIAEFTTTDERDPSYKIFIPFEDNELFITADRFAENHTEIESLAQEQYNINSVFSPSNYNKPISRFEMSNPGLAAFEYHFSSGNVPANLIHTIFVIDQNGTKRFVLVYPLKDSDKADELFVNIVRSYAMKLPLANQAMTKI